MFIRASRMKSMKKKGRTNAKAMDHQRTTNTCISILFYTLTLIPTHILLLHIIMTLRVKPPCHQLTPTCLHTWTTHLTHHHLTTLTISTFLTLLLLPRIKEKVINKEIEQKKIPIEIKVVIMRTGARGPIESIHTKKTNRMITIISKNLMKSSMDGTILAGVMYSTTVSLDHGFTMGNSQATQVKIGISLN